ncbi:MAG: hypothetical protein IPQ18_02760 [Saprospiraceae bacterium]|nr:hypothetical protein [Saprospiraceae bacterium]
MKKIIITFCFLTSVQLTFGQDIITFKISKPYCIFNFLETATNQQGTSSTLNDFIASNTKNDTVFKRLCLEFKNIQTDYNYKREEFPENRRQNRSTKDLIDIDLVNSNTLDEFKNKTIGILPNSDQQKLVNVLKQTEKIYDNLLWNNNEQKLSNQKKELELYASKSSEIFNKFQHFYNSSWTTDIPFIVTLYPIPGKRGNSTATPHANSLCVGVLTDETRHIERIGVVLHEMCHVLYDEQTKEFQHEIEKWFDNNKSPYKQYAYNFFDEGLATALGNGWAYKNLSGSIDTSEWYNNEYINGFAKELYPLVEDYINNNQQIDKQFIDKSIELFAKKFPNSVSDYGILLNRVSIYSDAETDLERADLMNTIGEKFQLSNVNSSSPILDKTSLEFLKNSPQTQLVIISKNQKDNFNALRRMFPELLKINPTTNTIFSFYDKNNRPIIILFATENKYINDLVKRMETLKYFDTKKIIQK